MKIIFLDFDGVLNGTYYVNKVGGYGIILDPEKMELLAHIVNTTRAKIVLSTSWREHWEPDERLCTQMGRDINRIFGDYGLKIYDKTPEIAGDREYQIESWLDDNPEVTSFVVLDDMFLNSELINDNFVRTSGFLGGLTDEDAQDAIRILNS